MFKLIIWTSLVALVWSHCNLCNTKNSVACHDENAFSFCYNGVPSYDYVYCPKDHVCTDEPRICMPRNQAMPECQTVKNLCGICSESRIFSCINETTIAFCFGYDHPNFNTLVHCPENTVCDLDNEKYYCSQADEVKPSCDGDFDMSTTSTTSTTPSTPRDPLTFCREVAKNGSFRPDGDTNCKKFIFCYAINNVWYGFLQSCPDDEYFDDIKNLCVRRKPENCD